MGKYNAASWILPCSIFCQLVWMKKKEQFKNWWCGRVGQLWSLDCRQSELESDTFIHIICFDFWNACVPIYFSFNPPSEYFCSGKESEFGQEDDYLLSNPYHLVITLLLPREVTFYPSTGIAWWVYFFSLLQFNYTYSTFFVSFEYVLFIKWTLCWSFFFLRAQLFLRKTLFKIHQVLFFL